MKVSDLIEYLGEFPKDAEVHIMYGYGDHWRTTVAPEVDYVGEKTVAYSDYHQMDKIVDIDEDDEDADEDSVRRVVVIG
jgi:hypothetical protein